MDFSPVLRVDLKTPCLIWNDNRDLKKSPGQLWDWMSFLEGQLLTPARAASVAANLQG